MKKWVIYAITWIVVVSLIFGVYELAIVKSVEAPHQKAVRDGSKIQVDYIGMLPKEYGGGLVFDTSLYSVAKDNISYPKTPTFKMRAPSQYKPLQVHVGGSSVGGYTEVVKGFSDGLIGMTIGETKEIIVPPDKGYGPEDPSLIQTFPLVDNITMKEVYPTSKFIYDFNAHPQVGLVVTNPEYHWPMRVVNVFEDYAIVMNEPVEGKNYSTGSWDVHVMKVDSSADGGNGTIMIKNLITPSDAYHIKGLGHIANSKDLKTFVLTSVDLEKGTYTIDYNDIVKGKTLIFIVTLISIDSY